MYRRGARAHVLVVEDYEHTREMYTEFLQFFGFDVSAAEDARAGLAHAFAKKPSLVVLDLALPDMPGWQAATLLRLDPRTRDVPIIAMTAYPASHARDVALSAGCDAFLEKPIGPNALAELIQKMLRAERA
ncbi:MAG TPA: response regulator [Labilithrix sp.]